MIDALLIWGGWALLGIGILGCFIPVLPGPPIAYAALLFAYFAGEGASLTTGSLVLAGVMTAVVTALDYIVPALGARKFNCSRIGTAGCFIGTIVGLFFLPLGVVLGPFLGALIGEFLAQKPLGSALLGATGAVLGYLAGIVLKLICCGYLVVVFWKAIH